MRSQDYDSCNKMILCRRTSMNILTTTRAKITTMDETLACILEEICEVDLLVPSSLTVDTSMLTLSKWIESSSIFEGLQKEEGTIVTAITFVSYPPANSEGATNVDGIE
ncbi:hypothetical protein C1H46_026394 [Malus baccata]|uniref:Uncharacterized protein n=1 Tax=Malus baccata TaxID=106549 RepID=A0A540LNG0_MALBA|nr:hypothetical protein C1H46_026394 [Malus baccata]